MTLIRREGFVSALREGILWYRSQDEHGTDAATQLAEHFAAAVDTSVAKLAERPGAGAVWQHRPGYRFILVQKPFHRWLVFYRRPEADVVELVDLIRGERDLPRRVAKA